jgi:hypothetical protein
LQADVSFMALRDDNMRLHNLIPWPRPQDPNA